MKYNYVLGLDIGISSVGWGLLALDENNNPYKIIDVGSRIFSPGEVEKTGDSKAKERREKRGYKSNREESNNNDNGKVKEAIKENTNLMEEKKYRTISEMYINDEKFKNKIKNGPDDYKLSVTNEMYLEEINKVLDSQIGFGLIDDNFKNEYLEIYNSRRHYSEGPGYYYEKDANGNKIKVRSPYGGDLIKKMTGICSFDKKARAPKYAFSSELFVSISKLVNLKYKS